MKLKIIFLSLIALVMFTAADAQVKQIRLTSGKLVPYGTIDTTTTADATPVIIRTINVLDNTAGIMEVTVVGSSATGAGVTGKLIYRYHKTAGTLTLAAADTASTVTVDTGVSGAGFALAVASNNLKLTLTGKASVPIRWRAVITPDYIR